MPYQSNERSRQQKDAKRTALMQASVRIFAEKGYQAATIRDIVQAANVAIGTFYFYFPDKETLFIHLYEETSRFLLQAIQQALQTRLSLPQQLQAGLQAYVNIALYEPAVVQLLLVSGVGAVPALAERRAEFRQRLIGLWQRPLDQALARALITPQNTRRTAEAFAGAFDEVILNLLSQLDLEQEAGVVVSEMRQFALRAAAYSGTDD
jgi:AcrR family transcriptional regulator